MSPQDLRTYVQHRAMSDLYLVVRKWILQVLSVGIALGLIYGMGTCHGALIVLSTVRQTP